MRANAETNRTPRGWDYEEHRRTPDRVLLRVTIHADNYREQTWARLEALDGLTWRTLVTLHPNDVVLPGPVGVDTATRGLRETADALWSKASELGIASERAEG